MDFLIFLLTDKIVLFVVCLLVLSIIYLIRARKNEKNEIAFDENDYGDIEQEINTKEEPKISKEQIIESAPEKNNSDKETFKNDDNLIMQKINKNMKFDESDHDFLSDEMINEISKKVKGLDGRISNFIERVDEDGKIILPFECIDFLAKKHEPLIMPDGSIRVLNLLSFDEELSLALGSNKPIFLYDEKNEKVRKLSMEEIEKCSVFKEHLMAIEEVEKLKIKIKNKDEENIALLKTIENYEDKMKILEDKEKTLFLALETVGKTKENMENSGANKKTIPNVEISNEKIPTPKKAPEDIPEKKQDEKKSSSKIIKPVIVKPSPRKNNKKTIETPAKSSEKIEDKEKAVVKNTIIESDATKEKNAQKDKTKREPSDVVNLGNKNEEKKKLSKKDMKKITDLLFSEKYFLSEDVLNNAKGKASENVFIYSVSKKDTTHVVANKSLLEKMLKNVLDELFTEYNKSPEEVMDWFDCKTVTDKFYSISGNPSKLYQAILCEFELPSELFMGHIIGRAFEEPFNEEMLIELIEINEKKKSEYYKKILDLLLNNKYEKII